jgi:streptomycin 6-kinase
VPGDYAGARHRLAARFGREAAEAWFGALPGLLAAVSRRWQLELGDPIPRGSMSVVFWCRRADGRRAVLKASPDRARLASEASALGAWHTAHAPAVIARDEQLGALLIEAVEPGTPLADAPAYPAVSALAQLLAGLHGGGVPGPAYPPAAQRVADLFDASEGLYGRHRELAELVPPPLHERGRELAARLAARGEPAVLLHGDLTPANVLDGGAGRLVAVDPAPCLGEPAFDAVDLILWHAADVPAVEARAGRLGAAAGVDPERILSWCAAFAAMIALELASQGNGAGPRFSALLELAGRA